MINDRNDAERRVALVTGASYGIGAACACVLARDGYDIVATELSTKSLADTATTVSEAGRAFEALELDLRNEDGAERVVGQALARFGRIDVLINNAGIPLTKPALDVRHGEFMEVIAVNVAGSYFMAQQVARHLAEANRPGSIVNLASTFSVIGVPNVSVYGISKAAVAGMTRHLAVEWASLNIRVNAVAPGAVETKFRKQLFDRDQEFRSSYLAKIPNRRFGQPTDVAEAVAYLAGEQSSYITGHILMIDGGLTVS